jgi:hypothetical protein
MGCCLSKPVVEPTQASVNGDVRTPLLANRVHSSMLASGPRGHQVEGAGVGSGGLILSPLIKVL